MRISTLFYYRCVKYVSKCKPLIQRRLLACKIRYKISCKAPIKILPSGHHKTVLRRNYSSKEVSLILLL
ncbi:hypothetical protein OLEAN_C12110 [Oleispira antarctica RB-8]|uniref:Uncharacterized protein n=1 Tax=Oleispira antarctica RB-8 TaxID=698738 RepID=R4YL91_OLEAN|nr:hypothetical protein OLEAN_C12110 [Oleispira antarctica RB-8]